MALALRPVAEGVGVAGALGVTVAAGVLCVGVEPPPRVRGAPTPRVARSPVSSTPSLPRILSQGLVLDCARSLSFSGCWVCCGAVAAGVACAVGCCCAACACGCCCWEARSAARAAVESGVAVLASVSVEAGFVVAEGALVDGFAVPGAVLLGVPEGLPVPLPVEGEPLPEGEPVPVPGAGVPRPWSQVGADADRYFEQPVAVGRGDLQRQDVCLHACLRLSWVRTGASGFRCVGELPGSSVRLLRARLR